MTEDEALAWLGTSIDVSRGTLLCHYVELLRSAAKGQNLVAPSTMSSVWSRHIVDSAQLLRFASGDGPWLDIGSGAGLPGIVIAALSDRSVELVEPRKLRTEFLTAVTGALPLTNVKIRTAKVEATHGIATVISARAVSSLDRLFQAACHRADDETVWILPKGRGAHSEVEDARRKWHGVFHVEQSLTAPDSSIIVATKVRRK